MSHFHQEMRCYFAQFHIDQLEMSQTTVVGKEKDNKKNIDPFTLHSQLFTTS